ncbi:hypothetical protein F7725_023379 [Dissostichus mawsoni]|uniref:Uncharacterized protein n=1 Tax=Dissostichus mawsoni TaxID=36200 RepID=A0A7J5Z0J1_DISMA|nr:hypothetical protein F7725_023379 [Dissostichus mawsoni]
MFLGSWILEDIIRMTLGVLMLIPVFLLSLWMRKKKALRSTTEAHEPEEIELDSIPEYENDSHTAAQTEDTEEQGDMDIIRMTLGVLMLIPVFLLSLWMRKKKALRSTTEAHEPEEIENKLGRSNSTLHQIVVAVKSSTPNVNKGFFLPT